MTLVLDHLLYAGPDLTALVRELTRLSGSAPREGGRHLGYGTHNALLDLGPDRYLEALATDPDRPDGAFADAIQTLHGPSLHAWCVRTGDPDATEEAFRRAGAEVVRARMGRRSADGSERNWELILPTGHPFAGSVPFAIHWGDTPHPAADGTGEVTLRSLELLTPDPEPLGAWLAAAGVEHGPGTPVRLTSAPARGLRASLHARRGPFALQGGAGGMRLH